MFWKRMVGEGRGIGSSSARSLCAVLCALWLAEAVAPGHAKTSRAESLLLTGRAVKLYRAAPAAGQARIEALKTVDELIRKLIAADPTSVPARSFIEKGAYGGLDWTGLREEIGASAAGHAAAPDAATAGGATAPAGGGAAQRRETPATAAGRRLDDRQIADRLRDQTVLVFVISRNEKGQLTSGSGTGFFIADNLVMTNQHVVSGSGEDINVFSADTGWRKGEFMAGTGHTGADGTDAAIIRVADYASPEPLVFAKDIVESDRVMIAGFPGIANQQDRGYQEFLRFINARLAGNKLAFHSGMLPNLKFAFGFITGKYQNNKGFEVIQHDAVTAKGNSGSPVVNQCGEVVAIDTYGWRGKDSSEEIWYNYSYSAVELVHFLRKSGIRYQQATEPCD